jgi:hypothetical protein
MSLCLMKHHTVKAYAGEVEVYIHSFWMLNNATENAISHALVSYMI